MGVWSGVEQSGGGREDERGEEEFGGVGVEVVVVRGGSGVVGGGRRDMGYVRRKGVGGRGGRDGVSVRGGRWCWRGKVRGRMEEEGGSERGGRGRSGKGRASVVSWSTHVSVQTCARAALSLGGIEK